jgi:hypothetical protein
LVIALGVIVSGEFLDKLAEVALTQRDDLVQTLATYSGDPSSSTQRWSAAEIVVGESTSTAITTRDARCRNSP